MCPPPPALPTPSRAALGLAAADADVMCSGRAAARCGVRSTLRAPAGDVVGDGRALRRDSTGAAARTKVAVDLDGAAPTAATVKEPRTRAALATCIAAAAAMATTPGWWPSAAAGACSEAWGEGGVASSKSSESDATPSSPHPSPQSNPPPFAAL